MSKCNCGNLPQQSDQFCRACGTEFEQTDSFLCECGAEVMQEDNFCHACGVGFDGIEDIELHSPEDEHCNTCGNDLEQNSFYNE